MKLHIHHRTTYRYEGAATYSIQTLKLTPRRDPSQRTLSWRIHAPGRRIEQQDAFGNITHLLTLEGPHTEVAIHAEGVVETDERFDGRLPAGFEVPLPSDDPALRDDEDPLDPGDLDLGLAPRERTDGD